PSRGGLACGLADRHGDEAGVVGGLDPHQHVLLAAGLGVLQCAAQVRDRADAFSRHVEDHVARLSPRSAAGPSGSTAVITTPLSPAPATSLAGATDRPSRGVPGMESLSFALACFCGWFGIVASVTVMVLFSPLRRMSSLAELPGAMPEISRASVRESF